jgi:hypothetical protein
LVGAPIPELCVVRGLQSVVPVEIE